MQRPLSDYISRQGGLDAASLSHLRTLVERYPYFHAARILLLRALYLGHDPSFSRELRRAAIYVPSRATLYQLIEGDKLRPCPQHRQSLAERQGEEKNTTNAVIESFLQSVPEEKPQRRPRSIDATQDYMAYLLQNQKDDPVPVAQTVSPMPGDDLIQHFIDQQSDGRRIQLNNDPEQPLQTPDLETSNDTDESYFTETLARIYIKQGKFDKAIEIIRKLSLKNPKKNRYFADQIRFLEKLIINNKNK